MTKVKKAGGHMEFEEKVVKNFEKRYDGNNLFSSSSDEEIEQLEQLVGKNVEKFINFYKKYQPYELPMLDCYVNLLGIDNIIVENVYTEPGKYLAKYGVYVFAVSVGGCMVCIDTNDVHNGDASVLIADSGFCFYNEQIDQVEIVSAPEKVFNKLKDDEPLILNYPNIKKSLYKIEKSFEKFMIKLSKNRYKDIEKYVDFD